MVPQNEELELTAQGTCASPPSNFGAEGSGRGYESLTVNDSNGTRNLVHYLQFKCGRSTSSIVVDRPAGP